jgi:hypothetical protein
MHVVKVIVVKMADVYIITSEKHILLKFPDWPPGARTANGTALCH